MNIKCPKCGGVVLFDPQSGKMKCKSCEGETVQSEFSTLEGRRDDEMGLFDEDDVFGGAMPTYSAKPQTETSGGMPTYKVNKPAEEVVKVEDEIMPLFADMDNPLYAADDEYMEMNIYHCSSCGADLMVGGTQASTFCSYCGAPSIVFDRVSKEVRPKKIIPFKLTEEQALKCIRDRFGDGDYIPKKIRELTVDKVRAIYIPYWLYSAYIRRKMTVHVSTNDDGNYEYYRDASCNYNRISLDASLKLNNEMSRRLEPFYMNELEDFDVAYLSGFYADKYDVPKDAMQSEAQERCRKFLDKYIVRSCRYVNDQVEDLYGINNYKKEDVQEEYRLSNVEYALLPAYFVNLKYDTGRQLVIVNGQTGKVIGNLPAEKGQIIRKFIKNAIITSIIFMFICVLAFYGGGRMTALIAILVVLDAFAVIGGLISYNRYKRGMQRLASTNMSSYVNKREDMS